MKIIRRSELAELLASTTGATIISLTFGGSDPARFKADRGRITKVSRFSGMINARYDRKKAKSLGVDVENVQIQDTPWKEHVAGPIYRHKTNGTLYVEFYPQSGESQYTLDGTPCQREDVRDLVRPPSKGDVPNYRIVKLENIMGCQIDKTAYVVV